MTKSAGRKDRLAAALRTNLKRRKIRSRAKAGAGGQPLPEGVGAEAPPAADAGSPPHLRRNMAQNGE